MLGLAQAVLTARVAAERHGVATIGKVAVQPGGVNAIASAATARLDARGRRSRRCARRLPKVTAEAERTGASVTEESWTPPPLRPGAGRAPPAHLTPMMGTGAGHDAGILANAGITAMLFVRNPTESPTRQRSGLSAMIVSPGSPPGDGARGPRGVGA